MWYQCYHSTKYPVTTFMHIDNTTERTDDSIRNVNFQEIEPNGNSTMIESRHESQDQGSLRTKSINLNNSERIFSNSNPQSQEAQSVETSFSVGHISHIPRPPPSPATYTIPSVNNNNNKSVKVDDNNEDIFGMIKLGNDDVCYTSGTIEWVGRKRSFPINSGFKTISTNHKEFNEPLTKKIKQLNKIHTSGMDKIKECDCADVLPTVNAIVDHLNALHEAVDLVDLRLNTLEDVVTKPN